jgi:AraC family 4-hydroxyphenylacetate 3-monooxygenase operon regulatory protein
MKQESRTPIPNIDIGKVYDSRYGESDINVEAFGKLAEFLPQHAGAPARSLFPAALLGQRADSPVSGRSALCGAGSTVFLYAAHRAACFHYRADAEGYVLTVRQELHASYCIPCP